MKKVAIILLLSIYAISTFGISLKEFYCCGKLQSVSLSFHFDENVKCSKSDDKSNCCKTKFQFYKVRDNHFASHIVNKQVKEVIDLPSFLPYNKVYSFNVLQIGLANSDHAPPLYNCVPTYISDCVFLI